ncbi:transcription-repair coupling factor [Acidithiobacillus concretivorus]|uniref:Transcription-repair-coupling factor n=1 Tax=Acidithiobacillus concretivorus TaxID=3063952 RepID=A0ABS5ZR40_9PROT|nr:transcription-repair coupling factor [Acidithiobacillus concretivorus]
MDFPLALGPVPRAGNARSFSHIFGAADCWLAAEMLRKWQKPLLVLLPNPRDLEEWQREWSFFAPDLDAPLIFPDREILPYDRLAPPADATATRLATLAALPNWRGLCLVPLAAALQRLPPRSFLDQHAFVLAVGDNLQPERFRQRLIDAGYRNVSEVSEPGELAWRGGIIDLFPSGSPLPYRIELFDTQVESIRAFDPETQRTLEKVSRVSLLPAREIPVDAAALNEFRSQFRAKFSGDPQRAEVYRAASRGQVPQGAEHYLPLFFPESSHLLTHFPADGIIFMPPGLESASQQIRHDWQERHEERAYDTSYPILPPDALILTPAEWETALQSRAQVHGEAEGPGENLPCGPLPALQGNSETPLSALETFLRHLPQQGRALIAAESPGRQEALSERLNKAGLSATRLKNWPDFLLSTEKIAITVAPLERGLLLKEKNQVQFALISEAQIFGDRVFAQRRSAQVRQRHVEGMVRDLGELQPGDAVTHEEYGIGRFQGMSTPFAAQGDVNEYVVLEYAQGDLVYVPADHLDRIARYVGNGAAEPVLSRLGSPHWDKAKTRAREKAIDAASELLDIYARRAARQGRAFAAPDEAYWDFVSRFPFEETPDQQQAIDAVIADMISPHPMDRLVCGDVGFGKTEVALRAAFLAAHGGAQVMVLVPTTLLAQQHYENFQNRFAGIPLRIEVLSRFQKGKTHKEILAATQAGDVRILIGTHRLLQKDVAFKDLGLLILDEEHRFGVRQKEQIKALRAEVDILTLTATPIPRTLNLSLAGLRDLSIIATPPQRRQPVRTFVQIWEDAVVVEACQRELHRGGQIYFLHNEVRDIERMASNLRRLLPEARLRVAHGQMPEGELEAVMLDFYHQRFDILLSTTIIESGIDNPHANTILINRADKFGLAQLHQLRGRVGRSHQRAYAYLFTPDVRAMSDDARRRLDAIQSLEDLGVGFALASHDLEIRGAGELLGEEQSGHMDEVGFTLFMEWLNDAVAAIRAGKDPRSLAEQRASGPEIHLNTAALIPDDYLPDVHLRLQLYKRLSDVRSDSAIGEILVEMIDRFGPLPDPTRTLLCQTQLRLLASQIGIDQIDAGPSGARLQFAQENQVSPEKIIALIQRPHSVYQLDGGQRLRIRQDLPDGEARCQKIIQLIEPLRNHA